MVFIPDLRGSNSRPSESSTCGASRLLSFPRAAYVHVPFCARRCGYCNFTLVARRPQLIEPYLTAVERELETISTPTAIDTLFFGGGTPTQLSPSQFSRLFREVTARLPLAANAEVSVEANPADVTPELAHALASLGVTRLNLGGQSFDQAKLRFLERDHTSDELRRTLELARHRFPSVGVDLIFGAAGETLESWTRDVDTAIALGVDHVSTYGLTFEKGTTFWSRRERQEIAQAPEEHERTLYAAAIDRLTAAGFEHYEVSNFARAGHRCRHNETYWSADEFFAFGPGAARYLDGRREVNHRSTLTYIDRMARGESPVAESEQLSAEDRAREALVLGMRRLEGVEREAFAARHRFSVDELFGEALPRFVRWGLISDDGRRVRLTHEGLFVSDSLWSAVLRV